MLSLMTRLPKSTLEIMIICLFRSDEFYFDPVGVFEVNRVVISPSGVWMFLFVEDPDFSFSEIAGNLIHLGSGTSVKRQMVQPHPATMIRDIKIRRFCLDEDDVCVA